MRVCMCCDISIRRTPDYNGWVGWVRIEAWLILQSYFKQSNYNKMLRNILVARKTMDHFSIFRIKILLLK